ncbi:MAG: hypothetical protein JNL67_06390 [Planctomycetaceae bacterium]|nr:hypothetical protein [Planctomycetaceae bacterium]
MTNFTDNRRDVDRGSLRRTSSACKSLRYRASWVVGVGCLVVMSGCQCWGPAGTCLRPNGLIARRADELQQQHLERSHYTREVPMFEQYLSGTPDGHQQLPSRFHPVPTRNVFQPPGVIHSGQYPEGANSGDGLNPNVQPEQRYPLPEELPMPQPNRAQPNGRDTQPPFDATQSPLPLELGPQASADLSHRQAIQYPYTMAPQQQVADWVRGNYGNVTSPTLRLHSALGPQGNGQRTR